MFTITPYTPALADEWNRFVAASKNGTFLFDRRYMDYHADRFSDHSLLVLRRNRLYGLLPGNAVGNTFYSHQGLTYGGLILGQKATADGVCDAFTAINEHLRQDGFRRVIYKPTPHIYHQMPSDEDTYALFVHCKARLDARNASSTILLNNRLPMTESRRSGLRKALAAGVMMEESRQPELFWPILTANLQRRYNAHPVHTLGEMQLLMSRFPQHIRLFLALGPDRKPLGGTLLYLSAQVVHTQYIAASPEGRSLGALDLLFDRLLSQSWPQRYFDFGTSASGADCELNQPLFFQKQGFGARTVCYDAYSYDL